MNDTYPPGEDTQHQKPQFDQITHRQLDEAANILMAEVHQIIRSHSKGLSEYELLVTLEERMREWGFDTFGGDTLELFRGHFFIHAVLYRLQKLLQTGGMYLDIFTLKIQITSGPQCAVPGSSLPAVSDERDRRLSEYYLDWNNLSDTGREDVAKMLSDASKLFEGYWSRERDLEILGLDSNASPESVTKKYRELSLKHHPDNGGDSEYFIEMQLAMERIRSTPWFGN